MDDYNITSLYESQNEWVARLVNILTPEIIYGFREMLKEAIKLCVANEEESKYLMTLQNFMARVPKWNETMVKDETQRIITSSGCNYLEDLISCVHVIQLKCLSCIRVGQKQKKVDIDIPSITRFIHQVYINCARKLYKNVYLFEQKVSSLEFQKNAHMMETIVKECIVNTIRDNVPVDNLLRLYLEDQEPEDVVVKEEVVEERHEVINGVASLQTKDTRGETAGTMGADADASADIDMDGGRPESPQLELEPIELNVELDDIESNKPTHHDAMNDRYRPPSAPSRLTFSDIDRVLTDSNMEEKVKAPKTIDRLEEISNQRYLERLEAEAEDDVEEELERLQIHNDENLSLESMGLVETL